MLQDKKIKGSAKNYNKIKRKKDQTRYNISGIKYHKKVVSKNESIYRCVLITFCVYLRPLAAFTSEVAG